MESLGPPRRARNHGHVRVVWGALAVAAALVADFELRPVAAQTFGDDPAAVSVRAAGLSLELAPLTLDQTRAFFIGRGFDPAAADAIARDGCVFRSNIGNRVDDPAGPATEIDLALWRVDAGAGWRPLRLKEDWMRQWDAAHPGGRAAVAFRWALFPTRQTFGPGDYNWGMITFGLAPGTGFDLDVRWRSGGEAHGRILRRLRCAAQ